MLGRSVRSLPDRGLKATSPDFQRTSTATGSSTWHRRLSAPEIGSLARSVWRSTGFRRSPALAMKDGLSGHDVANGVQDDVGLVVLDVVARVFDLDECAARRLGGELLVTGGDGRHRRLVVIARQTRQVRKGRRPEHDDREISEDRPGLVEQPRRFLVARDRRRCSPFWVGSERKSFKKRRSSATSGDSSGVSGGNAARWAMLTRGDHGSTSTTPATRSGARATSATAGSDPREWAARTTGSCRSAASSSATKSATWSSVVRLASGAGSLPPTPARSYAHKWWPSAASSPAMSSHDDVVGP